MEDSPIQNNDDFNEKYIIKEKKGSGGTAQAFVVVEKNTKTKYIAKIIDKDTDKFFEREVEILNILNNKNNPNIIRIIESGQGFIDMKDEEKGEKEEKKYMILEYAHNRELDDYVDYGGSGFGELHGKFIFSEILNGIRCVHDLGYCHKDLSMSNIFLDIHYNPKIGDFGAAAINANYLTETFGTPGYKCPEMNLDKPYDGQKADIFSLGAILIYLVFGKKGFKDAIKDDEMYSLIIENSEQSIKNYWEKMGLCLGEPISEEFKDLYLQMVSLNYNDRPNVDDILAHPWITSIYNYDQEELKKSVKENFRARKKRLNF